MEKKRAYYLKRLLTSVCDDEYYALKLMKTFIGEY